MNKVSPVRASPVDMLKAQRDVAFVARRCAGRGKKVYEKRDHARSQGEVGFGIPLASSGGKRPATLKKKKVA